MNAPTFKGNNMRMLFASRVGFVEFTKESNTKVGYLFDGIHNGVPVKSRATLTKVQ